MVISAETVKDQVFKTLKQNIEVNDGSIFYLIDRHGHVVADSSGTKIYSPDHSRNDDFNDGGNLRKLDIFKNIKWKKDFWEKGGAWERKTFSWEESS